MGGTDSLSALIPTEDQERYIQQVVSEPTKAALIASEMGAGKTLVAVESAIRMGAKTVLVICPLNTRTGWERTFRRQGWTLPIRRIDSTVSGKLAYQKISESESGVYLIGRELFIRTKNWGFVKGLDLAVYDEAHRFSNRTSVSFRVIRTLKPRYKIAMSGTFFGNKFMGAWAVCRWLWPNPKIVDNSFWRWAAENCTVTDEVIYVAGKAQEVTVVGAERVPGRWVASLPLYIRAELDLDVELLEPEKWYVQLTKAQRKQYNEIQEDMLTWLGDNPLVVELPMTMRTRLRQATLGELSFEADGKVGFDLDCKSTKIEALQEFLKGDVADSPVLILTDSKRFSRVVAHRLGDKAVLWNGDTRPDVRDWILANFGTTDGPQYVVATVAALGEGVDGLQHVCNTMVWLSKSDDNLMNLQVERRLYRTGQARDVRRVEIVAEDTYDEGVLNTLLATELQMRSSLRGEESAA